MKKSLVLLIVVALVCVTAAAWAGAGKGKESNLAPAVSGTVTSVSLDNAVLKSFVIKRAEATVTITVTADTTYKLGKLAGTADDVKVGEKVMVRLTSALADNAGTAKVVRVKAPK